VKATRQGYEKIAWKGGCGSTRKGIPGGLDDIIRDYIDNYREGASRELSFYGATSPLTEVIRLAANAIREDGKRHDHQRRIPGSALARFGRTLLSIELELGKAKSFAELYAVVRVAAANLKYIGELTIYDTTLRVAAKLGLSPQEVYLHAGTRRGAALFGIDTAKGSIPQSSLPAEFQKLEPCESEDVLCIYKNDFQRLANLGKLQKFT
jgi:hypothetical protein